MSVFSEFNHASSALCYCHNTTLCCIHFDKYAFLRAVVRLKKEAFWAWLAHAGDRMCSDQEAVQSFPKNCVEFGRVEC